MAPGDDGVLGTDDDEIVMLPGEDGELGTDDDVPCWQLKKQLVCDPPTGDTKTDWDDELQETKDKWEQGYCDAQNANSAAFQAYIDAAYGGVIPIKVQ